MKISTFTVIVVAFIASSFASTHALAEPKTAPKCDRVECVKSCPQTSDCAPSLPPQVCSKMIQACLRECRRACR